MALGAAVAALLVVLGVTRPGAVAGSLDDVFVVLADARGWLAELGLFGSGASAGLAAPEVEGSTSPLDVAVKALGLLLTPGADQLALAGWVGLGWLLVGGATAAWTAARLSRSTVGTVACAAGWAGSIGLVEAATYRLEGPLFAWLWLSLLAAAALRRVPLAMGLALLLSLARPEGLLLGPAAALWAGRGARRPWHLLAAAGIPALVTAVRWSVFGRLAPQSFYAKSSDDRLLELADGLHYLDAALRGPAGIALVLLVATVIWALWSGRAQADDRDDPRPGLLGLAALAALVLVGSGGDGYLGTRLALPLGAPVWLAIAATVGRGAPRWCSALIAVGLGLQLWGTVQPERGEAGAEVPWWRPDRLMVQAAEGLRAGPVGMEIFAGDAEVLARAETALAGAALAHRHAQRYRYLRPALPLFDLTGITSGEPVERPAPGRVTFGRDAIELGLDKGVGAFFLDVEVARPEALADHSIGVLADPVRGLRFLGAPVLTPEQTEALAKEYVPASCVHGAGQAHGAGWWNVLVRRDLASAFRAAGFRVGE